MAMIVKSEKYEARFKAFCVSMCPCVSFTGRICVHRPASIKISLFGDIFNLHQRPKGHSQLLQNNERTPFNASMESTTPSCQRGSIKQTGELAGSGPGLRPETQHLNLEQELTIIHKWNSLLRLKLFFSLPFHIFRQPGEEDRCSSRSISLNTGGE